MAALTVSIFSFSYKNGVPASAAEHGGGFVFDCRCLPNPGREERFKTRTGLEQPVVEYLEQRVEIGEFFSHAAALVDLAVRNYLERGFTQLMVCFGCTGGQHRSVYFAERLAQHLAADSRLELAVKHRDIPSFGAVAK